MLRFSFLILLVLLKLDAVALAEEPNMITENVLRKIEALDGSDVGQSSSEALESSESKEPGRELSAAQLEGLRYDRLKVGVIDVTDVARTGDLSRKVGEITRGEIQKFSNRRILPVSGSVIKDCKRQDVECLVNAVKDSGSQVKPDVLLVEEVLPQPDGNILYRSKLFNTHNGASLGESEESLPGSIEQIRTYAFENGGLTTNLTYPMYMGLMPQSGLAKSHPASGARMKPNERHSNDSKRLDPGSSQAQLAGPDLSSLPQWIQRIVSDVWPAMRVLWWIASFLILLLLIFLLLAAIKSLFSSLFTRGAGSAGQSSDVQIGGADKGIPDQDRSSALLDRWENLRCSLIDFFWKLVRFLVWLMGFGLLFWLGRWALERAVDLPSWLNSVEPSPVPEVIREIFPRWGNLFHLFYGAILGLCSIVFLRLVFAPWTGISRLHSFRTWLREYVRSTLIRLFVLLIVLIPAFILCAKLLSLLGVEFRRTHQLMVASMGSVLSLTTLFIVSAISVYRNDRQLYARRSEQQKSLSFNKWQESWVDLSIYANTGAIPEVGGILKEMSAAEAGGPGFVYGWWPFKPRVIVCPEFLGDEAVVHDRPTSWPTLVLLHEIGHIQRWDSFYLSLVMMLDHFPRVGSKLRPWLEKESQSTEKLTDFLAVAQPQHYKDSLSEYCNLLQAFGSGTDENAENFKSHPSNEERVEFLRACLTGEGTEHASKLLTLREGLVMIAGVTLIAFLIVRVGMIVGGSRAGL